MRITNSMLSDNFMYDLSNNLENMSKYQRQMSTGELINKASDNPLAASQVMQINTEIARNNQYGTNISDATQWLSVSDTALGQVNNVLQRINELLVSAGDPGYGQEQRDSIKSEINTNIGQLSQILNTSYDNKYVFSGTRGDVKPTVATKDAAQNEQLNYVNSDGLTALDTSNAADAAELTKIKSKLSVEVSDGVVLQYNVTAGDVMDFTTSSGTTGSSTQSTLGKILGNITSDLDSGNVKDLIGKDLSDIQDAINNVANVRTKVGALENRMTSAKTQNDAQNTSLTNVLSGLDDVDYANVTMQYAQAQTTYTASLQTSAKILQHTLMDYL